MECGRPAPLPRLSYESSDGWRADLLRVPTRAGASGEPVLLVHTAGRRAEALYYGPTSLAGALADAGFRVYLVTHRGDEGATGPGTPCLDRVATHDLPAALEAVLSHSGARSAHVMGFGLGALLALDLGARCPDRVASVAALAPPLRMPEVRSDARSVQLALQLLPRHWALPVRRLSQLGVPLIEGTAQQPGPRRRGSLAYTTDDVPVAFARTVSGWLVSGRVELVPQVGLEDAMAAGRAPMLVMVGGDDGVSLPEGAAVAVRAWGGPAVARTVSGFGHLDLLLGDEVGRQVHEPVLAWLEALRSRCWGEVERVA